eukprot:CAMPEP_0117513866 /NCGR_PEP_ID=MMETSP0784-20121206/29775_1 /TAXON_ID=39447 /ORGANISM="" /LENGTH=76 /DNA_ID=CAMNT_0005309645 /DNA_START=977 /DNA_END=1203 /DNA_ORIENTATION=-
MASKSQSATGSRTPWRCGPGVDPTAEVAPPGSWNLADTEENILIYREGGRGRPNGATHQTTSTARKAAPQVSNRHA